MNVWAILYQPSKHTTSPQRRYNVAATSRNCCDVVVTLCVYWELFYFILIFKHLNSLPYLPITFNTSKFITFDVSEISGWEANNVDPDQTSHSAVSDLGLYCLYKLVCAALGC